MFVSPAIAVNNDELACFYAIRHVLKSHKSLTEDDIKYAANFISSFYSDSRDKLRQNSGIKNILTDSQLLMILLYSDKKRICRFALIFNDELDDAIKSRDSSMLKRILLGPKEMFVELYDNPLLSNEDKDFIIRLIARESFALMVTLEFLKKEIITDDDVINVATKCYNNVCIKDGQILYDDDSRAVMSRYETPPESVFTIDKSKIYCFDTLELISEVTEEIPINPKTGNKFSDYALKLIRNRFNKEINMYRRYKQIKNSTNLPHNNL